MNPNRHLINIILILILCLDASCKISELNINAIPVSCHGKSDGSITINYIKSDTDKFEIILLDSLSKQVEMLNQAQTFPFHYSELHAGEYIIRFTLNGEINDYSVLIESPEQLKANKISIEDISGNQPEATATIKANPTGGTPPYSVDWSENTNNQKGVTASDLPFGIYRCMINDKNQCGPVSATIFLFESEIEKFLSKKEN